MMNYDTKIPGEMAYLVQCIVAATQKTMNNS